MRGLYIGAVAFLGVIVAGTVAYRLTEDPDQLDADMRSLMRLHAARWSSGHLHAIHAETAFVRKP